MALTERRIRYETLIRWHEDGKIGAHQVDLEQVLRDGVVISSTPTMAQTLATADFEGAVPLSEILGEVATAALEQSEALTRSLADVNAIAAQQLDQLTQVRGELSTAQGDLATAQQTIADLQAQLAQGHATEEAALEVVGEVEPAA